MLQELTNISSTRKDLQNFGLTVGVVLFLIFLIWRGHEFAIYIAIAGSLLIILGLTVPILLKPLQKVWMGFAVVMGFIVSHLILFVLFYLVFGPIGVIGRLTGKEFLQIKMKKNEQDSYWEKREKVDQGPERYEKQY